MTLQDGKNEIPELNRVWIIMDFNKIIINSAIEQQKKLDEIRLIKCDYN